MYKNNDEFLDEIKKKIKILKKQDQEDVIQDIKSTMEIEGSDFLRRYDASTMGKELIKGYSLHENFTDENNGEDKKVKKQKHVNFKTQKMKKINKNKKSVGNIIGTSILYFFTGIFIDFVIGITLCAVGVALLFVAPLVMFGSGGVFLATDIINKELVQFWALRFAMFTLFGFVVGYFLTWIGSFFYCAALAVWKGSNKMYWNGHLDIKVGIPRFIKAFLTSKITIIIVVIAFFAAAAVLATFIFTVVMPLDWNWKLIYLTHWRIVWK